MFRWLYILPYLIHKAVAARRDARIRFLNAQVAILRRKLGGIALFRAPTTGHGSWPSAASSTTTLMV